MMTLLARRMSDGLTQGKRLHHINTYDNCLKVSEAMEWAKSDGACNSDEEAITLLEHMRQLSFITIVKQGFNIAKLPFISSENPGTEAFLVANKHHAEGATSGALTSPNAMDTTSNPDSGLFGGILGKGNYNPLKKGDLIRFDALSVASSHVVVYISDAMTATDLPPSYLGHGRKKASDFSSFNSTTCRKDEETADWSGDEASAPSEKDRDKAKKPTKKRFPKVDVTMPKLTRSKNAVPKSGEMERNSSISSDVGSVTQFDPIHAEESHTFTKTRAQAVTGMIGRHKDHYFVQVSLGAHSVETSIVTTLKGTSTSYTIEWNEVLHLPLPKNLMESAVLYVRLYRYSKHKNKSKCIGEKRLRLELKQGGGSRGLSKFDSFNHNDIRTIHKNLDTVPFPIFLSLP